MSVAITFGSLGDIISICLLVKELVEALDQSRGSSAQYQQLIRELRLLEEVLLQVEELWRTCETTVELNALRKTSLRAAERCRTSISSFLKKVKKYRPNLVDGGSGKLVSRCIHEKVNAHYNAINMLLVTANMNLAVVNDNKLHARLSIEEDKANWLINEQRSLLNEVREQLSDNTRLVAAARDISAKVLDALRLEWFRQLAQELKSFMRNIFLVNIATYKAIKTVQEGLPSLLERTLYSDPFILEDAIGRIAPVHIQFINSWEAFDTILELRFRDLQGYKKVQNKEYVFQELATRREINRDRPWESSFLPGQKVVMSMLFNDTSDAGSYCPRCRSPSEKSQETDIQCNGCGMCYRRITEYHELEPSGPIPELRHVKKPRFEVGFGTNPFQHVPIGPEPPPKKRKLDSVKEDVTPFKRVRVTSKKRRTNMSKPVPAPFAGYAATRLGFMSVGPQSMTDAKPKINFVISGQKENQPNVHNFTVPRTLGLLDLSIPGQMSFHTTDRSAGSDNEDSRTDDSGNENEEDDSGNENEGDNFGNKNQIDDSDGENMVIHSIITGPLHQAAANNQAEAVKELLRQGISVESRDRDKYTALHCAASIGANASLQALLNHGADIDAHTDTMNTPLHLAAACGIATTVKLLLDNGANVQTCNCSLKTPLHIAARYGLTSIVDLLLRKKANYTAVDQRGYTALHCAAEFGNKYVVKLLLNFKADIEARNNDKQTPLHLAAVSGSTSVVELLLRKKANYAAVDYIGYTALHYAANFGHGSVVELLLNNKADIKARDDDKQTPLELAAARKQWSVVDMLQQKLDSKHKAVATLSCDKEPDNVYLTHDHNISSTSPTTTVNLTDGEAQKTLEHHESQTYARSTEALENQQVRAASAPP